jgi:hypothetical protein
VDLFQLSRSAQGFARRAREERERMGEDVLEDFRKYLTPIYH